MFYVGVKTSMRVSSRDVVNLGWEWTFFKGSHEFGLLLQYRRLAIVHCLSSEETIGRSFGGFRLCSERTAYLLYLAFHFKTYKSSLLNRNPRKIFGEPLLFRFSSVSTNR